MNNRPVAPVLALDIGNVAVQVKPLPLLNTMGFDSMEDFRAHDSHDVIWNGCMAFENGEMTVDQFTSWFTSITLKPLAIEDVPETWGSLLGDEINGVAEVVQLAVDHGVTPVFMSDICCIRFEMCKDLLSFAHLVSGAVLSYEVGKHKPHEDMYIEMENTFCDSGVPLLYVDDLLPNIEAGASRGWGTYHFSGNSDEFASVLEQRIKDVL